MINKLIYVVDDELNIRDLVKTYLQKEGYEVVTFPDGASAYAEFIKRPADMLVIDIMMPGMDGYTLCKEIRKTSNVAIIMVSAKDEEIDRILGLELGSDDYLSKPFSPRELVARVKNIFRRVKDEPVIWGNQKNELRCRDIVIYPDERRIICNHKDLDLTTKEFEFVKYLVQHKNRVFTREQLIDNIWGYDYVGDSRAIDDLVKRLRKKLEQAGSEMEITTVWGYGYKICE